MFSQKSCTQLKAVPDFSAFQFTSQGIRGPIIREVRFVGQKDPGTYNLDLDELPSRDPSSATNAGDDRSNFENDRNEDKDNNNGNNDGDMSTELATLILIIELYTERYPNRIVRLKGNTKEKARLFRTAIDKHVDILFPHFDIGLEQGKPFFPPPARSQECIDSIAFLLKRKPGLCLTVHMIQTTLSSRSLLFGNTVSIELRRSIEVGVATVEDN